MCLGCVISRGPGQDEVPCVVDEVLIVRPTIIGVMEIDVLVVRPYANRVKACRISLFDERTMHTSYAASLKIHTGLIVVDTAGLNRC